jgi:hypothetical protein
VPGEIFYQSFHRDRRHTKFSERKSSRP